MTTPNEGNENNEPNNTPEPVTDAPTTFTQEQVDTMNAKTRRETEAKFPNYADLKKKSDELDNLRHEKLTKEEQLTAELAMAKTDLAASNSRSDALQLENAISLKANEKGFANAGDANALVNRSSIVRSDTGEVVGIDEALDALLESRPYLRKSDKPNAPNLNGGPRDAAKAVAPLNDGEREMAHKLFSRLPHAEAEAEYAKGKKPR